MQKHTVEVFLLVTPKRLKAAGISTARLDALVLLEDVLRIDRTQLLAHPEREITPEQLARLNKMLQRRATHEPLAYIRNKTEFYGHEFYVDHRVLEPRPESETMIDLFRDLSPQLKETVIDIGTGSGALAITAKLLFAQAGVTAIDIDKGCLAVAKHNAERLGVDVKFVQGNLVDPVGSDILENATLLCNLPYVPDSFQINPAAMQEPRMAIFGGPDGLDLYRQLFAQLHGRGVRPAYILTESMPPQHAELTNIARAAGFVLNRCEDFIQVFRTGSDSSAS